MTASSDTPVRALAGEPGVFVVRSVSTSTIEDVRTTTGATVATSCLKDRFSAYMLPWAVSAAIFAPTPPPAFRRVFSGADSSRSELGGVAWLLDDFAYTEEPATIEQVRALNYLLALPAVEGFSVELPD
jgi:hypothetical protein